MPRLNRIMIKRFKTALDDSVFTLSDFNVAFPDTGKVLATATFIAEPHYSFQIISEDDGVYTNETPGAHYWSERLRALQGVPAAIDRIDKWCDNIKADMRAKSPVFDEFEELKEELKQQLDEHAADLDGYFTRDEAAAMGAKFDELIRRFEELRKKNEITERELSDVKRDLASLKEDAKTFQKAAFFRTAGNKIFNVCRRLGGSQAARTIGIEAAKEVTKIAVKETLNLPA